MDIQKCLDTFHERLKTLNEFEKEIDAYLNSENGDYRPVRFYTLTDQLWFAIRQSAPTEELHVHANMERAWRALVDAVFMPA